MGGGRTNEAKERLRSRKIPMKKGWKKEMVKERRKNNYVKRRKEGGKKGRIKSWKGEKTEEKET